MKNVLTLLLISTILIITSCSKDDCKDDVVGTYFGNENCGTSNEVVFKISTSSVENQMLFAIVGTDLSLSAEVSTNCGTFNIESQSATYNGETGVIEGLFNLNGDKLTGSLKFFGSSTCLYNLERQ